jgi:polyhydroxyalkanoate synthesis regulator phasin
MAQNPPLKRYLDAGIQFSQMTQQRAEGIVKDLVKAGEVQSEQAQAFVGELVDRSRKNSDRVVAQIRKEVRTQMSLAEFVTKDVVNRLQAQIEELRSQLPGAKPVQKAAKKTVTAAKKTAKKAPTKKTVAKKAPAAKRAAKKAPAKRAATKSTS